MAVTGTITVLETCTRALRKSGILGFGESASSEDVNAAMEELDSMLKAWQNSGYNLWTKTSGTLTLTTSASYTLSPVRPLSILSARLKRSGIETPMEQMTRDEYDSLPQKSSTGLPTQFYYDRQREAAVFYVWPVLSAANGETIEYTYEREIEDITSQSATLDVPGEWREAVIYNLAARLAENFPTAITSPAVLQRAEMLRREAEAFDREGSVFFCGEDY